MSGKRPRGQSLNQWSDKVKAVMGLSVTTAQRQAVDKSGMEGPQ